MFFFLLACHTEPKSWESIQAKMTVVCNNLEGTLLKVEGVKTPSRICKVNDQFYEIACYNPSIITNYHCYMRPTK